MTADLDVVMLTSDYLDSRHGGVESHIYYLGSELAAAGHRVTVLRVSPEPGVREAPHDLPFRHVAPPVTSRLSRAVHSRRNPGLLSELGLRLLQNLDARSVAAEFSRLSPNTVVHQHDFLANVRLSKLVARRFPVVWTNHLGEFLMLRRQPFGRAALRRLTSHYTFAIAPSAELGDMPWMGSRKRVWPNGVDTRRFVPVTAQAKARLRADLGWRADEFVVLVPRRWAPTKGVVVACQALKGLVDQRDVRAVFVGAGQSGYPRYAAEVRATLAEFQGATEVADFVEPSKMVRYYQASDVVLIPSFLEATSLAALEAMASGAIVVATRVGGMPELIEDGVNGFLVDPGDPAALARAITWVREFHPARRAAVSDSARETADGSDFAWSVIARRVADLYHEALVGHKNAGA